MLLVATGGEAQAHSRPCHPFVPRTAALEEAAFTSETVVGEQHSGNAEQSFWEEEVFGCPKEGQALLSPVREYGRVEQDLQPGRRPTGQLGFFFFLFFLLRETCKCGAAASPLGSHQRRGTRILIISAVRMLLHLKPSLEQHFSFTHPTPTGCGCLSLHRNHLCWH